MQEDIFEQLVKYAQRDDFAQKNVCMNSHFCTKGHSCTKVKKKYNNKKITYQGLGVTVAVKKKLNLINKNKTIQTKNTNKKIKN